jgi:PadR family transcriptional regulator, regulatory protein PadR
VVSPSNTHEAAVKQRPGRNERGQRARGHPAPPDRQASNAPGHSVAESPANSLRRRHFLLIIDEMKRTREFLGQHELLVMLAVLRLGRDAYGVPIATEIADRTGREILQGSVYATLDRLEAKGLVISELGEATPQRGGRAKRYFKLTAEGVRQVRQAQRALEALWVDLPQGAGTKA